MPVRCLVPVCFLVAVRCTMSCLVAVRRLVVGLVLAALLIILIRPALVVLVTAVLETRGGTRLVLRTRPVRVSRSGRMGRRVAVQER